MYYNMRVKTLQRNKADLLFRLETEKAVLQAEPKNRIHKLYSAVKDVSTGLAVILQSYRCLGISKLLSDAGLSLRGGGRRFPPATMTMAPGHFQRKIKEK